MLYLVEYANYNSQAKLGPGYTNASHTKPINSGGCDILGMKSGSADRTDNSSVIYRGIEDIFGNITQFIDGINIQNGQAYICYDANAYESDKFDGCYKAIGYTNATTSGYISRLGYDSENPLVALPIETNGTSNTYMSDSYVYSRGNRMALVGGLWLDNTKTGLWYWNIDTSISVANRNISARLLKTK